MARKKCGTCKTILKALESGEKPQEPDWNSVIPTIAILMVIPTAIAAAYAASYFTQQA